MRAAGSAALTVLVAKSFSDAAGIFATCSTDWLIRTDHQAGDPFPREPPLFVVDWTAPKTSIANTPAAMQMRIHSDESNDPFFRIRKIRMAMPEMKMMAMTPDPNRALPTVPMALSTPWTMLDPTQKLVAFSTTPEATPHAPLPADNPIVTTPSRCSFDPRSPPAGFHDNFVWTGTKPPHRFNGRYSWLASCTDWLTYWVGHTPSTSGLGSPGSTIALAGIAHTTMTMSAETTAATRRAGVDRVSLTPCPMRQECLRRGANQSLTCGAAASIRSWTAFFCVSDHSPSPPSVVLNFQSPSTNSASSASSAFDIVIWSGPSAAFPPTAVKVQDMSSSRIGFPTQVNSFSPNFAPIPDALPNKSAHA